ncbi:hypothetical protein V6Z11_D08G221400 [Gossypium hirsutum]
MSSLIACHRGAASARGITSAVYATSSTTGCHLFPRHDLVCCPIVAAALKTISSSSQLFTPKPPPLLISIWTKRRKLCRRRASAGEERAWWVWGIAERGWKLLPCRGQLLRHRFASICLGFLLYPMFFWANRLELAIWALLGRIWVVIWTPT